MTTRMRIGARRARRVALLLAGGVAMACSGSRADGGARRAEAGSSKGSRSTAVDSGETRGAPSTGVVLFVGTSLTAGLGLNPDSAYPQLIQAKIDSARLPFEVVNAGVSGETTSGLLRRMDWLLRGTFDVVLIETGANDGLRGIPVSTVERNLREIMSGIREAHPRARVLLVQMEAPPNLGPQYTNAFRAMYPTIAEKTGATLMPFLLEGVAGVRELNQGDGIHPNQRGEHVVADNVWKGLQPVLQGLAGGK